MAHCSEAGAGADCASAGSSKGGETAFYRLPLSQLLSPFISRMCTWWVSKEIRAAPTWMVLIFLNR